MRKPTVHDLIDDWVENRGPPALVDIRLGPARCGIGRCQRMHAYARTGLAFKDGDGIGWFYERPCDVNAPRGVDRVKP